MREDVNITDVPHVTARICGLRIMNGHQTEEGLHLDLEGGSVLIFTADRLVIALLRADVTENLH